MMRAVITAALVVLTMVGNVLGDDHGLRLTDASVVGWYPGVRVEYWSTGGVWNYVELWVWLFPADGSPVWTCGRLGVDVGVAELRGDALIYFAGAGVVEVVAFFARIDDPATANVRWLEPKVCTKRIWWLVF